MTSIAIKLLAFMLFLVGLYFGERHIENLGYTRAKNEDAAQINEQKAKAANELAKLESQVKAKEESLNALKNQQEKEDLTHVQNIATLHDNLRSLAGTAGRLRDPKAIRRGDGSASATSATTSPASASATNSTETSGLFSAEFSQLLLQRLQEADAINAAYISCRADSFFVSGQVEN